MRVLVTWNCIRRCSHKIGDCELSQPPEQWLYRVEGVTVKVATGQSFLRFGLGVGDFLLHINNIRTCDFSNLF